MNKLRFWFIIIVILCVIVGSALSGNFLAALFTSVVVAALLGGVFGGIVGAILATLILTSKEEPVKNETIEEVDDRLPEDSVFGLFESLFQLNDKARRLPCSNEVLHSIETVIDLLRELLPDVNENSPNSTATWVSNQTAKSYLPGLLQKFFDLPEAERNGDGTIELLSSLSDLQQELQRMKEFQTENKVRDFVVMSQALKLSLGLK